MPSLDQAFGVHEHALRLRAYRMELLSSNLANADTPNYKARDIDFQGLLRSYQEGNGASGSSPIHITHSSHMGGAGEDGLGGEPLYTASSQDSIDGNSVDTQVEKAKVMENSLHYQTTLTFLDGRIKNLKKALSGQ
jgi:flagellar basal-body rod protein FlgB